MLPRLAWPRATWSYPWASLQLSSLGLSCRRNLSETSSDKRQERAGAADPGQTPSNSTSAEAGPRTTNDNTFELHDEFYNIHFQTLGRQHPRSRTWYEYTATAPSSAASKPRGKDRGKSSMPDGGGGSGWSEKPGSPGREGTGNNGSSAGGFRSHARGADGSSMGGSRGHSSDHRASSSSSSSSPGSGSRSGGHSRSAPGASESRSHERSIPTGKRGMAWFVHHWPGAGLGLDDVEGDRLDQARSPGGRRARSKHKRKGSRGGGGYDSDQEIVWEDEGGSRRTERTASRKAKSYNRVFADDERSWFESWQWAGQHPGPKHTSSWTSSSSSSSSSSSTHSSWHHYASSGYKQQASGFSYGYGGGGPTGSGFGQGSVCATTAGHLSALGLAATASLHGLSRASIKTAFHNVAKQWHPDRHADSGSKAEAEARFKRAAEAYEHLLKRCALA